MQLTAEQLALRDAVRDLLRRRPPVLDPDEPGAAEAAAACWRQLCEIGVAGLAIPERFGGAGAGPVEVAVVAEELGRALAPASLLGSSVLATQAILACDDVEVCERLLPGLAAGSVIAALAWTGPGGGWDPGEAAFHAAPRSERAGEAGGGSWTLTGAAHYVLDGGQADVLIAAAMQPDGSIGLFEVDPGRPGVDRQVSASMDQTRQLAVVRLAAAGERLAGPGTAALARARDLACIALSAEQAGTAARALELTVRYTGTRVQFGRTIASFQAIQHRLAELHVLVESARSMSYHAASAAAGALSPDVTLLAAAAKAYCSQALTAVTAEMIQLHGAIGATWEHDAHRYFKRAHNSAQLFGPASAHLAKIAHAIIDQ